MPEPTDIITYGDTEAETSTFNTAFAVLSHNITIGKAFGLEAGVNFVYGFNNNRNEVAGIESNLKYTSYGLNAPILLNYNIPVSNTLTLKVLAGPTLHYGISSQITSIVNGTEMYTVDYYDENNYERFFVSAGAAVAAEFSNRLRLKAGYDLEAVLKWFISFLMRLFCVFALSSQSHTNRYAPSLQAQIHQKICYNKFREPFQNNFLGLTDIDKAEKISLRENLVNFTLSHIF